MPPTIVDDYEPEWTPAVIAGLIPYCAFAMKYLELSRRERQVRAGAHDLKTGPVHGPLPLGVMVPRNIGLAPVLACAAASKAQHGQAKCAWNRDALHQMPIHARKKRSGACVVDAPQRHHCRCSSCSKESTRKPHHTLGPHDAAPCITCAEPHE